MIWLVSYPRSGNTMLRNILYHVYGLKSGAFIKFKETRKSYKEFDVVKTHHLHRDVPLNEEDKIIYLVRDGRDSIISRAWRKALEWDKRTSYEANLRQMVLNPGDKNFGSWSEHVRSWVGQSHIIMKYENILENPKIEMGNLSKLISLPEPNWSNMPTIDTARKGHVKYKGNMPEKTVRRGIAGSWKDEMPKDLQGIFWAKHGEVMLKMGYTIN